VKKAKNMEHPLIIDLSVYQDESKLIEALLQGEHAACTCLFKRFAPQISTQVARFVKERDEVDDVVQESFIQACHHIKTFEGKSSVGTWLHRIAYNTALMHLRQRTVPMISIDAHMDEELALTWDALIDKRETPDAVVLTTERYACVNQALQALPTTLRAALVLRAVEGFSTKAAAEQLGIEEAALKVRVHRARQVVRKQLERYEQTGTCGELR
jgi:RNA polymerase sigma-70 factor, ECF subfamily